MKLNLQRVEAPYRFALTNEQGQVVYTDVPESSGGGGNGFRPMELLLCALASCSSIDVVQILQKKRQPVEDIRVEISGQRRTAPIPAVFEDIHLHFHLYGALDPAKVAFAINRSVETYCSVSRMIDQVARIHTDFTIHPAKEI